MRPIPGGKDGTDASKREEPLRLWEEEAAVLVEEMGRFASMDEMLSEVTVELRCRNMKGCLRCGEMR